MKIIKIFVLKNGNSLLESYGSFTIFANNFYTKDILANIFRRYLINNLV